MQSIHAPPHCSPVTTRSPSSSYPYSVLSPKTTRTKLAFGSDGRITYYGGVPGCLVFWVSLLHGRTQFSVCTVDSGNGDWRQTLVGWLGECYLLAWCPLWAYIVSLSSLRHNLMALWCSIKRLEGHAKILLLCSSESSVVCSGKLMWYGSYMPLESVSLWI